MTVLVNGSEIILSGAVGSSMFEDGFTSDEVIAALAEVGEGTDVTVRLNSGGGSALQGSGIHAALSRHAGKKTVVVEGVAASAASLIAMAGDEIEMSPGSVMMIHDPAAVTIGTVTDHEISIRALNAIGASYAGVYAARTGKSVSDVRDDMRAEIWLTPEDAVAQGYATRVGPAAANDDEPNSAVPAFDYSLYAHAPDRFVALAKKNRWRLDASLAPAASAAPSRRKETPMAEATTGAPASDNSEAVKLAAENATRAATASAVEIATICAEAGAASMTAALIRDGATADQARARVTDAREIRAQVDLARAQCPAIEANAAEAFIAAGTSVETAKAKLLDMVLKLQSPEISSFHQAEPVESEQTAADKAAAEIVASYRGVNPSNKKAH